MATREILSLNESTPQILAPQTGDTYLAPRTVTIQPEANTNGLVVSSGTLTADAPALDLTQTWNSGATTFTGLLLDVTNTASDASSKLLDLQIGSSSVLSVGSDTSNPGLTITNASAATLFSVSNSTIVGNRTLQLTPAANTSALTVNSGTLTADAPALDLTQTWNNSGVTFTGLKFNTTDTASASGSLLMDLQVGGTSKFKVSKTGAITAGPNNFFNALSAAGVFGNSGFGLGLGVDGKFGWQASSYNVNNSLDLILARDAAGILAQRNTTNAQTFRIYNTYTDASNYERGKIQWDSNVLKIGTEKAGTGTARALELQTDGTTRLTIAADGSSILSSATFFSAGSELRVNSGGSVVFNTRISLYCPSSGILRIADTTGADLNRIQFGGSTSSFPALKRSSTSLIVRLADDSANAPLESASLKTDAPTGGTAATWKLGTVASVTPTSPDRTIEVDIGGTIYYLHAKTTND